MKHIPLAFALIAAVMPAYAQETDIAGKLSIELNAATTDAGNCTVTFVVTNGHAQPIDSAVFETVLFNANGQVDRLTLFDFGTLPPARPRVRQFAIAGLPCDAISRVLFNGAATCEGAGLPATACEADLSLSTRTDIEVIG